MTHPNLVAWYKGNGNAEDSSGNGHHGTWVGTPAYAAGKFGQGFEFDGASMVEAPDRFNFIHQTGTFTMSFWLFVANAATNQRIMGGNIWSGGHGLGIDIASSNIRLMMGNGGGGGYSNYYSLFGATITSGWNHVTMAGNGTNALIRINGHSLANQSYSPALHSTANAFTLFRLGRLATDSFFTGIINDLRIYNAALSPSDIRRVMHGFQPIGIY